MDLLLGKQLINSRMPVAKKRKEALERVEREKLYPLNESTKLVKEVSTTKFDASVDLAVRLGVDPKKANQMVRGTVSLPHGIGKTVTVLALVPEEKEEDAKEAGADYVGLDEYIKKIQGGWTDFDVVVTMPSVMPKIGRLGRVLGPRGLMPNPKSGTVTDDISSAVSEVKAGKIDFKVDKYGIINTTIGRASFTDEKLYENATELLQTINRLKPSAAKGVYFKSISISSTMSPGIKIDSKTVPGL